MALGLKMAGFEHKIFSEIDESCVKTLKKNRPNWNILSGDIRTQNFNNLRHKIALVSGGFPCQLFSQAGKRKGFDDERGNLFFEFKRVINKIDPPYIVTS